jgi:hypothetical protein
VKTGVEAIQLTRKTRKGTIQTWMQEKYVKTFLSLKRGIAQIDD